MMADEWLSSGSSVLNGWRNAETSGLCCISRELGPEHSRNVIDYNIERIYAFEQA